MWGGERSSQGDSAEDQASPDDVLEVDEVSGGVESIEASSASHHAWMILSFSVQGWLQAFRRCCGVRKGALIGHRQNVM